RQPHRHRAHRLRLLLWLRTAGDARRNHRLAAATTVRGRAPRTAETAREGDRTGNARAIPARRMEGHLMAVTVHVTSVIQAAVNGQREFSADGGTVGELIANIDANYPGFAKNVMDEEGALRRFVNIYL